ncbi:MAG: hypothetical protein AAGU11_04920, partial [Syntrophobacteraceae bacterium]
TLSGDISDRGLFLDAGTLRGRRPGPVRLQFALVQYLLTGLLQVPEQVCNADHKNERADCFDVHDSLTFRVPIRSAGNPAGHSTLPESIPGKRAVAIKK